MKFNRIAINNIIQMVLIQLLNYAFPIVTIPYLLRTVHVTNYGKIATGLAIVQICILISDYGFNFTATQKVAIQEKVESKLFSTIFAFKVLFSCTLFIGVLLITILNQGQNFIFIIGLFFYFFAQSLIPAWIFRGVNKVTVLSLLTALQKGATLILMICLVHNENDYGLMSVAYAIPSFLILLISFSVVRRKYNVRFSRIHFSDILIELNEGKDMFLSNAIGTLYTTLNPVILSLFAGPTATGIYSTCEKIITVINSMTNAISQAVYPIVCKIMDKKVLIRLGEKINVPVSFVYFGWWPICVLAGSLLFVFWGDLTSLILRLVNGTSTINTQQFILLRIMLFIPFFISLGHLFGIQSLIPLNDRKSVRKSVTHGAIINMIFGTLGSMFFGAIGMGSAVLFCEVVVSISMLIYLKKNIKENNYSKNNT